MVAATNPVINNVSGAASKASAGAAVQGSTGGTGNDSNNSPDDFMQLLGGLLGDDSSASTSAPANNVTTDKSKQSDKPVNNTTTALPQWLLPPLPVQSTPAPAATTPAEGEDDAIDALTPANNAAANALLTQSLKRFNAGGDKDQTGPVKNTQTTDASSQTTADKAQDSSTLFDALMLKPDKAAADSSIQSTALLTAGIKDKQPVSHSDANPRIDSLLPGMTQAAIAHTETGSNSTAQYEIHSKVGSHEWVKEVGNRLSMMVSNKVQSASLQLTPDNLGPVQVKIDVNSNQASVWFTADHPDTRTALEQSLPRLRELFASQGMSLTDAGVFNQQSQQQSQPQFRSDTSASYSSGIIDMSNEPTATQQVLKIGLLDTYA